MKVSNQKQSRWLYLILLLMLLALVGFSIFPLLNSIVQVNQSLTKTTSAPTSGFSDRQAQLEAQAQGYQLVLQREPDNQAALRGLLDIRLQQGDLKAAALPLERLAQLNPEQTDYWILLAQTKQQVKDYQGAGAAYRTILAAHPWERKALEGIVNLFLEQERPEAAISLVQETLKKATQANIDRPNSVDMTALQLLLAQVYALQKRYPEALAIYDQVIDANPEDFRPVFSKAVVLQGQGKLAEAKLLFDRALSLAPPEVKAQIRAMAPQLPASETDPHKSALP